MLTLYKSSLTYVLSFVFVLLDFTKNNTVRRQDVCFFMKHIPSTCPKCRNPRHIVFDIGEELNNLFGPADQLSMDEFVTNGQGFLQIPELIIDCLLSGAPSILEDCVFGIKRKTFSHPLFYRNKQFFFQLTSQCLSYGSTPDMSTPKGVILLNDLYVESGESSDFILRNGKFYYEFTAESHKFRDIWVQNIRQSIDYRELHDEYSLIEYILSLIHI